MRREKEFSELSAEKQNAFISAWLAQRENILDYVGEGVIKGMVCGFLRKDFKNSTHWPELQMATLEHNLVREGTYAIIEREYDEQIKLGVIRELLDNGFTSDIDMQTGEVVFRNSRGNEAHL